MPLEYRRWAGRGRVQWSDHRWLESYRSQPDGVLFIGVGDGLNAVHEANDSVVVGFRWPQESSRVFTQPLMSMSTLNFLERVGAPERGCVQVSSLHGHHDEFPFVVAHGAVGAWVVSMGSALA